MAEPLVLEHTKDCVVLAAGAELLRAGPLKNKKKRICGQRRNVRLYFGAMQNYLEPHPGEHQDACGFLREESTSESLDDVSSPLILRATNSHAPMINHTMFCGTSSSIRF